MHKCVSKDLKIEKQIVLSSFEFVLSRKTPFTYVNAIYFKPRGLNQH